MREILYFGHPVNAYGTPLEEELLKKIASAFPNYQIENPNQPKHQEGYKRWKNDTGNGMDYYYKEVLANCRAGIFLLFPDGAWGKGVFGEAEFLANDRKPIWSITPEGVVTQVFGFYGARVLSVEETRARLYVNGKDPSDGFKPFEIK